MRTQPGIVKTSHDWLVHPVLWVMPSPDPKRVLIMEPNHELRASMTAALEAKGYFVVSASSGNDTIFRLRNQKFSCLILSLDLGEESIALIEALRAGNKTSQPNHETPAIMVASSLSQNTARRLAGKVQGAMLIPFEAEALVERVTRAMQ